VKYRVDPKAIRTPTPVEADFKQGQTPPNSAGKQRADSNHSPGLQVKGPGLVGGISVPASLRSTHSPQLAPSPTP
jgi:hypothetical protein